MIWIDISFDVADATQRELDQLHVSRITPSQTLATLPSSKKRSSN
jgi:hypothetical protein